MTVFAPPPARPGPVRPAPLGAAPVRQAPHGPEPTYYELPAIKPSLWGWKVSGYMFLGGVAGSAQIIATMAEAGGTGQFSSVVRNGRFLALGGAMLGAPLLIIDLHTPQRWYNMFRIFRRTSPMSIGTYVLTVFGLSSAVLAGLEWAKLRGNVPAALSGAGAVARVPAVVSGAAMSTYTAALLSATSNPLWGSAPRLIAALFGVSAMASAGSALALAEQLGGGGEQGRQALSHVVVTASIVELAISRLLKRRFAEAQVEGALRDTGWGAVYAIGPLALGCGMPLLHQLAGLVEKRRSPVAAFATGVAVLAGGLMLRHVLLRAGNASASRRPRDYFRFTRGGAATADRSAGR